jgi:hypothetical protein
LLDGTAALSLMALEKGRATCQLAGIRFQPNGDWQRSGRSGRLPLCGASVSNEIPERAPDREALNGVQGLLAMRCMASAAQDDESLLASTAVLPRAGWSTTTALPRFCSAKCGHEVAPHR